MEKKSLRIKTSLILLCSLLSFLTAAPLNDSEDKRSEVCPRIISRSEWKARPARSEQPLKYSPAPYVVVHHGGTKNYCFEQKSCSAIVKAYQNWHLDNNKWQDIGYHFVIGEDGNVYEGRGWDLSGAHAPGYNTQGIGVSIIGDFTDRLPNEAALKALRSLISCGVALGKLRKDYLVIGHRQVRNTECPGESLYKYVQNLPNWTDDPKPIYS